MWVLSFAFCGPSRGDIWHWQHLRCLKRATFSNHSDLIAALIASVFNVGGYCKDSCCCWPKADKCSVISGIRLPHWQLSSIRRSRFKADLLFHIYGLFLICWVTPRLVTGQLGRDRTGVRSVCIKQAADNGLCSIAR